jgi:nucleoside-diphosphate-sugar epimerase
MTHIPQPVFITGIGGFIASHLAERLLREGIAVRGLTRRPEAAAWLVTQGAQVTKGDLLDAVAVARAVAGCRVVVHAAGWAGNASVPPDLAWRTNVEGTANVLTAAKGSSVERFVYISSIAVYGLNRAPQIDESMPTPFVGELYPDSKIAAEAEVRASSLPNIIVRPASTYGPRGEGWTVGVTKQIRHGMSLLGHDDGLVTPGYIDNVVDGLWLTLTHQGGLGHVFNICDDRAVTYREFYLAYAYMLGLDNLPTVPVWRVMLARTKLAYVLRRVTGRPSAGPWSTHFRFNPSQYSIEKARRLMGYEPQVDFAEGMRRTETWLRANGYLS